MALARLSQLHNIPKRSTPIATVSRKGPVSRSAAARLKAAIISGVSFPALPKQKNNNPKPGGSGGSRASYASVAAGRANELVNRKVTPFLSMVMNPFERESAARYPDETIVPTALTHFQKSTTYSVDATGTVYTVLGWKADQASVVAPISLPAPIGGPAIPADYDTPQAQWATLSAVDRTLACGIRVRLTGLPVSTFMPSGTLYFLQVQKSEFVALSTYISTLGEPAALQAVTAGKGFSVTVNELSKSDGIILPYLPQGPMSFVFSDTNSLAAASAGLTPATAEVVAANGNLLVVGFGMNPGQTLRFDYAHHIEYIPTISAAGIVATSVEPPNMGAREAIGRGAQVVQQRLAGSTSLKEVAPLTSGLPSIAAQVGRMAVGLIPGGSALVGAGAALARGLGAPAWLTSALDQLK